MNISKEKLVFTIIFFYDKIFKGVIMKSNLTILKKDLLSVVLTKDELKIINFIKDMSKNYDYSGSLSDYNNFNSLEFINIFEKIIQYDLVNVLSYILFDEGVISLKNWTSSNDNTLDVILMLGIRSKSFPCNTLIFTIEEKKKVGSWIVNDYSSKRLVVDSIIRDDVVKVNRDKFVKYLIEEGVVIDEKVVNSSKEVVKLYDELKLEVIKEKMEEISVCLPNKDKERKLKV